MRSIMFLSCSKSSDGGSLFFFFRASPAVYVGICSHQPTPQQLGIQAVSATYIIAPQSEP